MANDPIAQFQLQRLLNIQVGDLDLSFTNSSLFMVATAAAAAAFVHYTSKPATDGRVRRAGEGADDHHVPGRLQAAGEMAYDFVANMLRDGAGREGMRFFPFVFSLFLFVLFANLIGMFPYFFTVTSHIIVTFALALLVIGTVVVYGIRQHGVGFFGIFVPSGVPGALIPLVAAIEVISFLSRPVSLGVRLFANMLAGHIALKVFAGFIVSLSALGFVGVVGAILPLIMTVAITALEFLVSFLQAYVFAVLTCMYLNDALHPHH